MAKHLSFSVPAGARQAISLCSFPLSASIASFSPPLLTTLLQGEKAGLSHDLTDRLNHYLHHVDEVQKEFLGILLSVSGEFWVSLSNEGLKHAWSNAILHTLQITRWKRKVVIICQAHVLACSTLLLAMLFFR